MVTVLIVNSFSVAIILIAAYEPNLPNLRIQQSGGLLIAIILAVLNQKYLLNNNRYEEILERYRLKEESEDRSVTVGGSLLYGSVAVFLILLLVVVQIQ